MKMLAKEALTLLLPIEMQEWKNSRKASRKMGKVRSERKKHPEKHSELYGMSPPEWQCERCEGTARLALAAEVALTVQPAVQHRLSTIEIHPTSAVHLAARPAVAMFAPVEEFC